MHGRAVLGVRHEYLQAMPVRQPPPIEVLLHGEGGAEQAHALDTGRLDPLGREVDDMDQLGGHGLRDLIRHAVHGIVGDHQYLRPSALERRGGGDHAVGQGRPVAGRLQRRDFGEVERPEDALGGGRGAQPVPRPPIDDPVIFGRAFPAHAAD
ncbi:hypothetical protein QE361_001949 [Sphingomonas sp. SORGH_AS802]|nr:hypothetical protein [Sphingomonas sp. SORGH_AS_0438]MDR6134966.1 hypothetical protein [Sphingomonas sp. SORGH_AS_0802]